MLCSRHQCDCVAYVGLALVALMSVVRRWISMIGVALAVLAGAIVFGWTKRGQVEATKALEGYKKTRKEMDSAPTYKNDPDGARRFLRERLQLDDE